MALDKEAFVALGYEAFTAPAGDYGLNLWLLKIKVGVQCYE